jgi:hypothetical protein
MVYLIFPSNYYVETIQGLAPSAFFPARSAYLGKPKYLQTTEYKRYKLWIVIQGAKHYKYECYPGAKWPVPRFVVFTCFNIANQSLLIFERSEVLIRSSSASPPANQVLISSKDKISIRNMFLIYSQQSVVHPGSKNYNRGYWQLDTVCRETGVGPNGSGGQASTCRLAIQHACNLHIAQHPGRTWSWETSHVMVHLTLMRTVLSQESFSTVEC